jgi:hypothetical protein
MGNQWKVKGIFNALQNESAQSEVPQFERITASKRGRAFVKILEVDPQDEGDIRSIKEIDKEKREAAVQKKALNVFEKTYPDIDLRRAKLEDLIVGEFKGTFKPPRYIMENLVVRKWFEGVSDKIF